MGVCSLQDFSSAWEKIYHYHANTRLWSPVVNALELGHILSKAQSQFFVVFFLFFSKISALVSDILMSSLLAVCLEFSLTSRTGSNIFAVKITLRHKDSDSKFWKYHSHYTYVVIGVIL